MNESLPTKLPTALRCSTAKERKAQLAGELGYDQPNRSSLNYQTLFEAALLCGSIVGTASSASKPRRDSLARESRALGLVFETETWGALGDQYVSGLAYEVPSRLGGLHMKATIIIGALLSLLWSTQTNAGCLCQCVNGQMQPLCDNSIEIPPICPPVICPIAPPSIAPIQPPTIPPLGTSFCRQAQVCDTYGNCRWQQVCQ